MDSLIGGVGSVRARRRRRSVLLMVVVVAAALASVLAGGSSVAASSIQPGAGQVHRADGKVGEPVRDGKFEFTVQSVKCGVAQVGEEPLARTAQGQFCLVTVKVKNIGDKPQTLTDSAQKGFGADGKQYKPDTTAGIYANTNSDVFLNEINPGNEVMGVLVFDIPKDGKLAKLELHDSLFSRGATVQVS